MLYLVITTGLGTAFSFLLALWAPSCVLCDALRAISLSLFAVSIVQLFQKSSNLRTALMWLAGLGLAVAAVGHLMAAGAVGCPLECKKVELLGMDVRSLTFLYFAVLCVGLFASWRRRSLEIMGFSGLIAILFVAPVALPTTRKEGNADIPSGNLLFVNSSCPKCKQLLSNSGTQLLNAKVEVELLGDMELRQQVYSTSPDTTALLISYAKREGGDLYEFTRHFYPVDMDVRRGTKMSQRSEELASRLRIPEVPYLVVSRNGSYVGIGSDELLRKEFTGLLGEAEARLATFPSSRR